MDSPDHDREPDGVTADGMGTERRGPSFVPWTPVERLDLTRPAGPVPARPSPSRPARSILPTVISVLAIVVVAVVVVAASLVAHHADTHVVRPASPVVSAPTPAPDRSNQIDFTSSRGTGKLMVINRSWVAGGDLHPINGSYLRVELELVCESGTVDYDPFNFQASDEAGRMFELDVDGAGDPLLASGTLKAGERVRGTVGFDIPHGASTLLMTDESDRPVTALRVPD